MASNQAHDPLVAKSTTRKPHPLARLHDEAYLEKVQQKRGNLRRARSAGVIRSSSAESYVHQRVIEAKRRAQNFIEAENLDRMHSPIGFLLEEDDRGNLHERVQSGELDKNVAQLLGKVAAKNPVNRPRSCIPTRIRSTSGFSHQVKKRSSTSSSAGHGGSESQLTLQNIRAKLRSDLEQLELYGWDKKKAQNHICALSTTALATQPSDLHRVYAHAFDGLASSVAALSPELAILLGTVWNEYVEPLQVAHKGLVQREQSVSGDIKCKQRGGKGHAPLLRSTSKYQNPLRRQTSSIKRVASYTEPPEVLKKLSTRLSCKMNALRLELVSMQRLREVIFMERTDKVRNKIHYGALFAREDMSNRLHLDAFRARSKEQSVLLIQKHFRRKLAAKKMNELRVLALTRLTKKQFETSIKASTDSLEAYFKHEDETNTELPHEQLSSEKFLRKLEQEAEQIVWESKRFARDLTLKWWKRAADAREFQDMMDERDKANNQYNDLCKQIHTLATSVTRLLNDIGQEGAVRYFEEMYENLVYADRTENALEKARMLEDTINELDPSLTTWSGKSTSETSTQTNITETLMRALVSQSAELQQMRLSISLEQSRNAKTLSNDEKQDEGASAAEKRKSFKNALSRRATQKMKEELERLPAAFRNVLKIVGVNTEYFGRPLTMAKLRSLITDIYFGKIYYDSVDFREGNPKRSLAEYVYEMFFRKYGLRKVAEKHILDLISGVHKHHANDPMVRLFARFCQIVDPLDQEALDFFLFVLDRAREMDGGKAILKTEDSVSVLRSVKASELTNNVATIITNSVPVELLKTMKYEDDSIVAFISKKIMDLHPITVERKNKPPVEGCLNLHALLAIFVEQNMKVQASLKKHLIHVFKSGDDNGDGVLTLDEFSAIVQQIQPCSMNKVSRMFFEASEISKTENANAITPEAFVEVAKKYGFLDRRTFQEDKQSARPASREVVNEGNTIPRSSFIRDEAEVENQHTKQFLMQIIESIEQQLAELETSPDERDQIMYTETKTKLNEISLQLAKPKPSYDDLVLQVNALQQHVSLSLESN